MRRNLFGFASAMSLLLFLITVALFFFRHADIYSSGNPATSGGEHAVYASSGTLGFSVVRDKKPVPTPSATEQLESYGSDLIHGEEQSWSHMGVSYSSSHFTVTHELGLDRKATVLTGSWGHVTTLEISLLLPLLLSLPSHANCSGKPVFWGRGEVPPHERFLQQVRL